MTGKDYPIGTELRSTYGTIWVKVRDNEWYARGAFGELDEWTLFNDHDVYGEEIT